MNDASPAVFHDTVAAPAANDHSNPPTPGLRILQQREVTPTATNWAVRCLQDPAMPLFGQRGPRLLGGKLPIVAVKQWHPPDPPVGPNAWHYGVTLFEDQRDLPCEGIDLSHYQGISTDWEKEADSGRLFMITKSSEGAAVSDDAFAANWANAKRAGLLRGAYHFFRPQQDPAAQASLLLSRLAGDPGELPPSIDVEVLSGTGMRLGAPERIGAPPPGTFGGASPAAALDALWAMIQVIIAKDGRRPLLYTAPGFWAAMPANETRAKVCAACDLWVATWGPSPIIPAGWTSWRIWQYAGDVAAPGVNGFADLDRFAGGPAALLAYAAGQPAPSPEPRPAPPPPIDLGSVRGQQLSLTYLATRLKAPELDPGGVDGVFGPKTSAATIAFCKREAVADFGPKVQAAMRAELDKLRGA